MPWISRLGATASNTVTRGCSPNLGVFASKDPVAVDKVCLDMSDKSLAVPGSKPFDEEFLGEPWKSGMRSSPIFGRYL